MKPFWWKLAGNFLAIITWSFFIVAPLVWAVRRWLRASPRIATPAWRGYLSIGATTLVSLSELFWLVSAIWIAVSGGGSYDQMFERVAAIGFLAAVAGLLASLFGKGTLRWPAYSLSILTIFSWLVLGLADL